MPLATTTSKIWGLDRTSLLAKYRNFLDKFKGNFFLSIFDLVTLRYDVLLKNFNLGHTVVFKGPDLGPTFGPSPNLKFLQNFPKSDQKISIINTENSLYDLLKQNVRSIKIKN